MSYIRHNAIVVTASSSEAILSAASKAEGIGLQVIGPSAPALNGYQSLLVCPDGSKEGWPDSDAGDVRRAKFREWLNARRYEDGSSALSWAEVTLSPDDSEATLVTSGWDTAQPHGGQGEK